MNILLTSTSFQDTPGKHHELLSSKNIWVDKLRGPLTEIELLAVIDKYDGIVCGDDEYTKAVINKGATSKLKVISKYGVGLDSIDVTAARELGVQVRNCPGVNQVSVAEHVMALLLAFYRNIPKEIQYTSKGEWVRLAGEEISGKTIGILGYGSVGKEVAKRALAFGLTVKVFDKYSEIDTIYQTSKSVEDLCDDIDILSLHLPLNAETKEIVSVEIFKKFNNKTVIVNTSRAGLIDNEALLNSLENKQLKGYLTDVLEKEPMIANHPLLKFDNVFITPHIGSRTLQAVEKQGMKAVENLFEALGI